MKIKKLQSGGMPPLFSTFTPVTVTNPYAGSDPMFMWLQNMSQRMVGGATSASGSSSSSASGGIGLKDTLSLLNTAGTRTVKLRPAQVAYLSFPIVPTGDIEGTVYMKDENGIQEPKKGIIVNLYKEGTLVGNKISEYDGYYSFPQTPLGHYTVKLDPDQSEDLELHQSKKIEIALTEPEQLEVRDIVLLPGAEEPEDATGPATTQRLYVVLTDEPEEHFNVPVPLTEVEEELPQWLESAPDLVPLLLARVVNPAQQKKVWHTKEKTVSQLLSEQTVGQYLSQKSAPQKSVKRGVKRGAKRGVKRGTKKGAKKGAKKVQKKYKKR